MILDCIKNMSGLLMSFFLRFFLLICLLISLEVSASGNANNQQVSSTPSDTGSDVMSILTSLTCETSGIWELLDSVDANTCIPEALSTIAIATIISPGLYLPLMFRTKVGFDKIPDLKTNCNRNNRADPANPTLTFGMCNNIRLFAYLPFLLAQAVMDISNLEIDYTQFHEMYYDKSPGDWGLVIDVFLGGIPVIPYKVYRDNDRICVGTYSILGTLLPLGCKYIREPYPVGLYQQFFNNGIVDPQSLYQNINSQSIPKDMQQFFNCSTAVAGCAQNATNHSQTLLPISSIIIECIRSTLLNTLVTKQVCNVVNGVVVSSGSGQYGSSTFHGFQKNMQRAVMAFLTLYVIFIGFKLVLAQGEVPPIGEFVMYGTKLILVIYFSIGININGAGNFDGMTQWIFPLLLNAANEMATWIAEASPSGLCVFPIKGVEYADGMGRLALWDTLDCKVAHYLGFDALSSMFLGGANGDNFGNSVPPYIFLLIPALITGQINLVMLALAYPLIVISIAAYLVTTFSVCLICITTLAVLAPLYVPFVLFDQTKGYFEAWYRLMISFALQPVVVVAFMTVMFGVYDQGFYTGCEFSGIQVDTKVNNNKVIKQVYVLQTDKTKYVDYANGVSDNYNACTESLGWMLNEPIAAIANNLSGSNEAGSQMISVMNYSDYKSQYSMMSGIQTTTGVFFSYFSLLSGINKQLIINLFACILMLYLMRELSGDLSNFASDIASGVPLGNATISANALDGSKIREKMEDFKDNKKAANLKGSESNIKRVEGEKGKGDSAPKSGDNKGGSSTAPKIGK